MTSIYDFLPTEASNSATGGVNSAEGMDPSAVNDAARAWKQLQARWLDDIGGVVTVGGTADAVTVTLAEGMTALATGMIFGWKAPGTNTGAATAALSNSAATLLGTPKIRRKGDTALSAGDMISGGFYLFRYDAAYDTGTGALVLLNPEAALTFATPTQTVTGTSTTLAVNPLGVSAARLRRNLFDNPALQISTVNGNTAGTTNGYEIADGWKVYRVTSAGTITAQRVQSTTPAGAPDRGRITITVADASLAAGEFLIATKTITGREVAHLKYGTASALQTNFRALFKFPAGTYAYSIQNTAANRSYVGLFTPASANTDEVITANIPGDQSGTWPIDTSQWTFNIVLAAGSTFQGTTGWQAGNILGTSGVTNGMATGSAVFEFGETGWYADPESTGVAPVWELPSYDAVYDGLAITPWVAYTPTFTALGTVTSISMFSRRVGSSLEIMGKFVPGTTTGSEMRVSIGFNGVDGNVVSDTTVVASIRKAGTWNSAGTGINVGGVLIEQSVSYMTFGGESAGVSGLSKAIGTAAAASGLAISLEASIPIQGWNS